MQTLYEAMTKEEQLKVEHWMDKIAKAKTTLGILYCEVRINLIANAAERRIQTNKAKKEIMHLG